MQSALSDDPDWQSAIDLAAALRRRETAAAETLEVDLAALQARRVNFEEYDLPDLKTVNGWQQSVRVRARSKTVKATCWR